MTGLLVTVSPLLDDQPNRVELTVALYFDECRRAARSYVAMNRVLDGDHDVDPPPAGHILGLRSFDGRCRRSTADAVELAAVSSRAIRRRRRARSRRAAPPAPPAASRIASSGGVIVHDRGRVHRAARRNWSSDQEHLSPAMASPEPLARSTAEIVPITAGGQAPAPPR